MGIEFLLVLLGVVLFGGLFLGLVLSWREVDQQRLAAEPRAVAAQPRFYGADLGPAASSDRVVLYLEHYLRRERLKAQRFAETPSLSALLEDEEQDRAARAN